MAHNGKKNSTGKMSKTAKNEFERVLKNLEKENESYRTPKSHVGIFYAGGAIASAAPLTLFSGMFDGKISENLLWYGVVVALSTFVLGVTYDKLATRTRRDLVLSREPIATTGGNAVATAEALKKTTIDESAYYSLFSINTLYLVLFFTFVGYLLPPQQLPHSINFAVAALLSVGIALAAVYVKAL